MVKITTKLNWQNCSKLSMSLADALLQQCILHFKVALLTGVLSSNVMQYFWILAHLLVGSPVPSSVPLNHKTNTCHFKRFTHLCIKLLQKRLIFMDKFAFKELDTVSISAL